MKADNLWREDQTIRATNIFVGVARDNDSLKNLGVAIALQVNLLTDSPIQVSAVVPPEQALEIAYALCSAARDSVSQESEFVE